MIDLPPAFARWLAADPSLVFHQTLLADMPGAELYLVGGAIRDIILGRPCKDADFVLRAVKAEDFEPWFNAHGTLDLVGRAFGVYKFIPHGHPKDRPAIDIALPRSERPNESSQGGYRDFDITTNETLPIEVDLERRDFTINAMAYDIRNNRLLDPFDGRGDLKRKLLHTVGDAHRRFSEDLTRLLRGLRFACELKLRIHPETWKAMQMLAPALNRREETEEGSPYVVARETIASELAKALVADPTHATSLLTDSRFLPILFPSIAAATLRDRQYFSPLSTGSKNPNVLWVLLLRALAPTDAQALLADLRISSMHPGHPARPEPEDVVWILKQLADPHPIPEQLSRFERRYLSTRGHALVDILRALGKTNLVDQVERIRSEIYARWQTDGMPNIPELLNGHDLLRLGAAPGPIVRRILEMIRDRQLAGDIMTREAALAEAQKQIRAD
ncbi:CCA tRNA nucleotidyltransferase [Candidatus Uhrbacteria bacterium]|nr:CCA tRNA nucleotidyltransferase [Candidatus Uhrbacteria bacterium]